MAKFPPRMSTKRRASTEFSPENELLLHELVSKVCPGTSRSLIAFDVDKTILHQSNPNEFEIFKESGMSQTLIELARLGFNIAAVIGNSLLQLSVRFLDYVIQELCAHKELNLIVNFHFFCNGAALYLCIGPRSSLNSDLCKRFSDLLSRQSQLCPEELLTQAREVLFDTDGTVDANFIVLRYAQTCCIPQADAQDILAICRDEAEEWWKTISTDGTKISEDVLTQFYIATGDVEKDTELKKEMKADPVNTEASLFGPRTSAPDVGSRTVIGADGNEYITALNVLPVLSLRHARNIVLPHHKDPRILMIDRIRRKMRKAGLVRYIVSPGGRGTIDISHHLVNKRSAITWLLSRLGVEGVEQLGEPFGANAIYFGDEVVINGNDLIVADIPGITVFAVNELINRVPFQNNILLPTDFTHDVGPEGTLGVLRNILQYCRDQLAEENGSPWTGSTAIASWKLKHMKTLFDQQCTKFQKQHDPITYRRLEAALAVLTLLQRNGEGVDEFANNVINQVNNLGMVSAHVQEEMFERFCAQGAARHGSSHEEEDLFQL